MLAQIKINNVNISSFWGTQCGVSVGEVMAFKGEERKERKSKSFRLQGASEAERDKKQSEGTDDAPKELLIA